MITYQDGVFRLDTDHTSYLFRVTSFGHVEHIHYGEYLAEQPLEALLLKHTAVIGSTVAYDARDPLYSLDTLSLEWSGIGKGDYRHAPAEIRMPDGSFVTDFVYQSHRIVDGFVPMTTLPTAYGTKEACQTLVITLKDLPGQITLDLYYTVYAKTDVITRRNVLTNNHTNPIVIRKLMSMMIDLPNRNDRVITFHGGWIKETHRQEHLLSYGLFVQESTTGASSNRHNPGFLLAEQGATESHGRVYAFNLIYSGNHYSGVERSGQDLVRVMTGINPHCFEWPLATGEFFETPEAVMTFSDQGFNGQSGQFHDFVNEHIVRGDWQNRERPVLINTWESHFFSFTRRKLLALARRARTLGIELFVLDDGWFGSRNSDSSGLGDYAVNRKKLPGGLGAFSGKINRLGMKFGLWFEPEMVNPDSDLYRAHPEYAVTVPGREPSLGRNQLVLDLCNPDVRDYIVHSVSSVLDQASISYVKWDMNRHMSDMYSETLSNQGQFFHRYIIGLYDILARIFEPRPGILLETCSSGGNRFDLGMLCYSPQIWASDNTDPIERLSIQEGLSYLYPLSTMGAHVSGSPHQQTLRATPLSTRFNVAAFGCLGYELDPAYLSPLEKREVKDQIAFYKEQRATMQFGRFFRLESQKPNKVHWETLGKNGDEAVAGFFQTQASANEGYDSLPVIGLDPHDTYQVRTHPQNLYVRRFGALIQHILPFRVHPEGFLVRMIHRFYCLTDCVESYEANGDLLLTGVRLNTSFVGSYYNSNTRLLGDFGSNLYTIRRLRRTSQTPKEA
jgi:alpha-galactosidase